MNNNFLNGEKLFFTANALLGALIRLTKVPPGFITDNSLSN